MADDIIIKVSLEGAQKELSKLEKLQKGINMLADEKKRLNKSEKELTKAINQTGAATSKQNAELEKIAAQQVKNNAALKLSKKAYSDNERQVIANTKANQLNKGSLVELRAQLSKDTFAYDRLTKAERENANIGGKLRQSIKSQSDALKKLEDQTGRNQRSVGNYKKSFGSLRSLMLKGLGALGITAGLAGLVNVMKGAVKIAKDFEQGNANLASVLGKSRSEITKLTDDAKRLGASTSFTASEVSKLQTEFAKLGFNEKEILNATEATLDLAAATGADLADAAAIAGATLGGFGLDASETQRVTDVMAKSFSTSALDLEKFKESMKTAAPAARAVGVSVEETTALLGTLSNAGISGSVAGTALRKSFIELNAAGLTLDEGLAKVANSEDQLGAATDLVGKKAASSFLILANGTSTTKELEAGLNNAGGAAKKMADEQLDTLEGKTKILGSAWEGLVLSLLAGDGAFSSIAKSIVEGATGLLGFATQTDLVSDALKEERIALGATKLELLSANTSTERRKEIIDELKRTYPKHLENIDAETSSNEELVIALANVNKGLIDKIILQQKQEEIAEQNNKTAQQSIDLFKAQDTLQKQFGKSLANFNKGKADSDKFNIDSQKTEIENAKELLKLIDKEGGLLSALSGERSKLAASISGLRANTNLLNQEEEKGNVLLTEKEELMARLGISTTETTEVNDISVDSTNDKSDAIDRETAATNSLIDAQKELKKIAGELPETTEAEIAAKNQKIETIDNEISRLNDLGKATKEKTKKVKDSNDLEINAIDKKISKIESERALEAATTDETTEQKLKKEIDLLDKTAKLKIDKAREVAEKEATELTEGIKDDKKREVERTKIIGEAVSQQELENKIAKAELDGALQEEIDQQELEAKAIKEEKIAAIKGTAIEAAETAIDASFDNQNRKIDENVKREVDALNLKREAGEISEEEFNANRLEIDKKAFEDRKKLSLKENTVDFAVAAGKTLATYGFTPAAIAPLALLAVKAIAERSTIKAQKFAKGGIIHGASHANGGVDLGNNQEAEGGEAIINKRSTAKHLPLLSAINQDGGGVALGGVASPSAGALSKFGNGGITNNVVNQSVGLDLAELETRIAASINTIKVQNVASETTGVANRVETIQDSATF